MDIRQLEMLLAVAETGGYAKAGQRLWITHSAIHRQIKLLEEEVKDRILVKNGKRMELTDTGRILLGLAKRVLSEVASAERTIADRNELIAGQFRIGTSTTSLTFFLPPILSQMLQKHPALDLHILTGPADHVFESIRMRHLDIGIVLGGRSNTTNDNGLLRHFLYQERFALAVSKHHPLASDNVDGTVQPAQLNGCTFIMHSRSSHVRRMIDRLCEEHELSPKVGMELENEETMELMVAINMGVAFLSSRRANKNPDVVYLELAQRPITCDVSLVYSGDEFHPPIFKEFMRLCHEHVERIKA